MSSLVSQIPLQFMDPEAKFSLINWIAEQGFPARIGRDILQQWSAALGVTVYPSDYQLIDDHFRLTKG
jgi:hypothetical protein